MAALRDFMFERVYLGPAVRAEHAKISAVLRRLFEHYVEHPELLPGAGAESAAEGDAEQLARQGHGLPGGDDRPLLHPRSTPSCRCRRRSPASVAAVALYTSDSKDRVRDAVDFVELVSARTELRRAGPARYEGLCPFHDERTPSFGIDPTQKVYYCFGCQASGDVFTFVQETEGVDFKGALELLAERYGVELEREEEDPRAAQRRRRRERLLELLVAHGGLLRALPVGVEGGAGRTRVPRGTGPGGGDPARVPRRLRAERVGPGAAGLAPRRLLRGGALRDGPRAALEAERAPVRPLPLADHVPAGRHPRAGARLRRARDARGAAAEVPEHLRQRRLPQGAAPVRRRPGARPRGEGRGR